MKKLLTIGILSVSLCTFTKEVYPSSQDLERVMNLFTNVITDLIISRNCTI